MNPSNVSAIKVAIIVPNVCDPDYRVVKQAETLARAGYDVRVFCGALQATDAPALETLGGVDYVRRAWQAGHTLKSMFRSFIPFSGRPDYAPIPPKPKMPTASVTPAQSVTPVQSVTPAPTGTRANSEPVAKEFQASALQDVHSAVPQTYTFSQKVVRILKKIARILLKKAVRILKKVAVIRKKILGIWRKLYSHLKGHVIRFYRRTFVLFFRRVAFRYIKHHSFRYVFEEEVADWQPDVIHVHDMAALYLGYKLSQRLKVPFVFDSHELETHRSPPLSSFMKFQVQRLEQRCLPKAAAVTTVGQEISKYLSEAYKIPAPRVIYNAPAKFPTPMPGRWAQYAGGDFLGEVRTDVDLAPEVPILAYTGNIAINRGIEETIDALAYIKEQRSADFAPFGPLHLVLVGRCQPVVQERLEQKIKALGLEGHVHFQPPVPASGVSRYISSATVSVIPIIPVALSYEYAMPNKLFEAMIARLPILGSHLTEMSQTIASHHLGESFAHGNPQDFSDKLLVILSNRERYLGSTRDAAIDQLSWEAQEEVLLSVFSDVLAGAGKKAPA